MHVLRLAERVEALFSEFAPHGTSRSYPRGTLKYAVTGISWRFAIVVWNAIGSGFPSSMYSVPPLYSTIPMLWFPPNV